MKSIQRTLIATLLLSVTTLALAAVSTLYVHVRSSLIHQFDAHVLHEVREIGGLVQVGPGGILEFGFAEHAMPEFGAQRKDPYYFQIWRDDGRVFAKSPSTRGADLLDGISGPGNGIPFDAILPDGRAGRAVRMRVASSQESNVVNGLRPAEGPPMTVAFACGREEINNILRDLAISFGLLVAALTAGTIGIVVIAVRIGLRPLRAMAESARAIDVTSLDFRFQVERLPVELAPIALRLNESLARLDEAFRRERRFTADVSHELRTPIAELRTLSEVALRWSDSDAAATEAGGFQDVRDIAVQMERIVHALLTLVRVQAGRQRVAIEAVDLSEVVNSAWRPLAAAATKRGLSSRFQLDASQPVNTDLTLLGLIVGNLLANALRYASDGGSIECSSAISSDGSRATLRIGNSNASLTAADLPHVWEPFWRKDAARTGTSQNGLGLSLVQNVSNVLGIKAGVSLPRPDWFVVTLSIPLAPIGPAVLGERESIPASIDA